jgi:hypothetical protein
VPGVDLPVRRPDDFPEVAMLSHEDERQLAEIERRLLVDDPAFARRLSRPLGRRPTWWKAAAGVVAVLCALATVVGVLAGAGSLALSSAVLTALALWVVRGARPRPGHRPPGG